MTDSCRKEIISSLAIQMFQYTTYQTSEEYTTVCCGWLISTLSLLTRLVMELRVHLLDVVNCTNYKLFQGSWKEQLRRKIKNMRQPNLSSTVKRPADELIIKTRRTYHQHSLKRRSEIQKNSMVADDVTESTCEADVATLLQEKSQVKAS